MEIYNLYNSIVTVICQMNGGVGYLQNNARPFILALAVGVGAVLALFILQGVGLFIMSKKRKINKKFLCFIPFASIFQIGRLTGPCDVFGRKMKRAGLYAMLAQIVCFILCSLTILCEYHLFVGCGDTLIVDPSSGYVAWESLSSSGMYAYNYYKVSEYLVSIVGLVEMVLMFILLMGLFKKYAPRNYLILSWLALFIPLSRFIVIFVLRNRTAIDFDAYMRARREAYARRAANYGNPYGGNPYGGNPYGGNPYGGNPYGGNPYGGNPYGQPQNGGPQKPPEEPFSEFSEGKREEPFSEFSERKREEPFSEFSESKTGSFTEFSNAPKAPPASERREEEKPSSSHDDDDLFD